MGRSEMPTYDSMMNDVLQALRELGGSGTIQEIDQRVIVIANIPEEVLEVPHGEQGTTTEIEYRLAWTRTYLKKYGLLENSQRGVWALTSQGRQTEWVDPVDVVRAVREMDRQAKAAQDTDSLDEQEEPESWEDQLLTTLKSMAPDAFERLAQRILRESGFTEVEVMGKSGDGGIDGKGIMQLEGLISFHVFFQCKRYQGSVGSGEIRDFRGAMTGRADKGIFITTGHFTPSAKAEATRDGAPPIDLVDGERLIALLKKLHLGVHTKTIQIEEVTVDHDWFASL